MAGASTSAGAPPKRLSTAAQFFDEEDQEAAADIVKKSTYDKVRALELEEIIHTIYSRLKRVDCG